MTSLGVLAGLFGNGELDSVLYGALGYLLSSIFIKLSKVFNANSGWLSRWTNLVQATEKLGHTQQLKEKDSDQGDFFRVQKFTFREGEPFVIQWIRKP